MTETNLLPCPFCGGEATPKLAPYIGGGGCGYIVDCDECWSKTGYYSQKSEAIAAWNTRATHGTLTAEQAVAATLGSDRDEIYNAGFRSGMLATLQQLDGMIAGGDGMDEIKEWIEEQMEVDYDRD